MKKGDILTKAIAIATRKGFKISDDFFTETPVEVWIQPNQDFYFSIIFCHEFAQCFFGDDLVVITDLEENAEDVDLVKLNNPIGLMMANRANIRVPLWQYHLAQMVLSEDPLNYLNVFVEDNEQTTLN